MRRQQQIACYVTVEVAEAFVRYAHHQDCTISDALRKLVERAIKMSGDHSDDVQRRLLFIETGVDALLAEHPTTELRAATHNAFQTRLRSEGLAK